MASILDRWKQKELELSVPESLRTKFVTYNGVALPESAAPFLDFNYLEDDTPQSEYYGGSLSENRYKLIGFDGGGDPICIELSSGHIVLLSHDDGFKPAYFMNSSIESLAECLLAYLGEESSSKFKSSALNIDSAALGEGAFWLEAAEEIEL